jgi:hypothetical protein
VAPPSRKSRNAQPCHRHSPQLPFLGSRQARRRQPPRGSPDGTLPRLDLTAGGDVPPELISPPDPCTRVAHHGGREPGTRYRDHPGNSKRTLCPPSAGSPWLSAERQPRTATVGANGTRVL